METILCILLGIGLSAACGFRVFVPLLIVSMASGSGHLTLAPGFDWIGTTPALITFSLATALEIGAYYIPWLDNLLDTVATPAAVVAGTIVTASVLTTDMSPWLRWTLAAVAGGGSATIVQGGTVLLRGISTAATGGFANPIFATAELGGAVATSITSLMAPVVAVGLLAGLAGLAGGFVLTRDRRIRSRVVAGSVPPQLS